MKVSENLFSTYTIGSKGLVIESLTTPSMNKTGNPFLNRVQKHTWYTNAYFGCRYGNCVTNYGNRQGIAETYEPAPLPNWANRVNKFFIEKKSSGDMYLTFTLEKDTTERTIWLLDGRAATPSEVEEIKTFLVKKSENKRQAAYGLHGSDQVDFRMVNMENIISVRQGSRTYYER